jgi:hypothetical protein
MDQPFSRLRDENGFITGNIRDCRLKTDLIVAYQKAATLYAKAVRDLTRSIGAAIESDYETLERAAEKARSLSHDVRDRLNKHTEEHGC